MSENILIGKSRKTGKWEFILDPGESYDKHLRAYHKIANAAPVNEDFTRVLCGRVQNTSTALSLITVEEAKQRAELLDAAVNRSANVVEEAQKRQEALDKQNSKTEADRHAAAIAEKNAIVDKVRRDVIQIEKKTK
jgi:hypothetical protein